MFVYTGNKPCIADTLILWRVTLNLSPLTYCWLDNYCWFINVLPPKFNAEEISSPTVTESSFVLWYSLLKPINIFSGPCWYVMIAWHYFAKPHTSLPAPFSCYFIWWKDQSHQVIFSPQLNQASSPLKWFFLPYFSFIFSSSLGRIFPKTVWHSEVSEC